MTITLQDRNESKKRYYYVYIDFTTNDETLNTAFYVGIGNYARVRNIKKRNEKHANVSNKYGIHRCVVFKSLKREECCKKELTLIKRYRTHVEHKNAQPHACNFTTGGDGFQHSAESREKMRQKAIGKKMSPEACKKMSESKKGRAPWNKGKKTKPRPQHERDQISAKLKGRLKPQEVREKMSKAQKGSNHHAVAPIKGRKRVVIDGIIRFIKSVQIRHDQNTYV